MMGELEKIELKKKIWNSGVNHIEETEDINLEFEMINRPHLRRLVCRDYRSFLEGLTQTDVEFLVGRNAQDLMRGYQNG